MPSKDTEHKEGINMLTTYINPNDKYKTIKMAKNNHPEIFLLLGDSIFPEDLKLLSLEERYKRIMNDSAFPLHFENQKAEDYYPIILCNWNNYINNNNNNNNNNGPNKATFFDFNKRLDGKNYLINRYEHVNDDLYGIECCYDIEFDNINIRNIMLDISYNFNSSNFYIFNLHQRTWFERILQSHSWNVDWLIISFGTMCNFVTNKKKTNANNNNNELSSEKYEKLKENWDLFVEWLTDMLVKNNLINKTIIVTNRIRIANNNNNNNNIINNIFGPFYEINMDLINENIIKDMNIAPTFYIFDQKNYDMNEYNNIDHLAKLNFSKNILTLYNINRENIDEEHIYFKYFKQKNEVKLYDLIQKIESHCFLQQEKKEEEEKEHKYDEYDGNENENESKMEEKYLEYLNNKIIKEQENVRKLENSLKEEKKRFKEEKNCLKCLTDESRHGQLLNDKFKKEIENYENLAINLENEKKEEIKKKEELNKKLLSILKENGQNNDHNKQLEQIDAELNQQQEIINTFENELKDFDILLNQKNNEIKNLANIIFEQENKKNQIQSLLKEKIHIFENNNLLIKQKNQTIRQLNDDIYTQISQNIRSTNQLDLDKSKVQHKIEKEQKLEHQFKIVSSELQDLNQDIQQYQVIGQRQEDEQEKLHPTNAITPIPTVEIKQDVHTNQQDRQ